MKNLLSRAHVVFFWYWALMLLWQFARPVANRSVADVLFKVSMFSLVILAGRYSKKTFQNRGLVAVVSLFIITQFLTILSSLNAMSIGHYITIVFLFVQIYVFLFSFGGNQINEDALQWLAKVFSIATILMCIYNVIFKWNRFKLLLISGNAYGSECKSFLYSNHEFALYTVVGILSSAWLILTKKISKRGKRYLIIYLPFLFVNLLSTYSRTAIASLAIALPVLLFAINRRMCVLCCLFASVFLIGGGTKLSFFQKVLKGSFSGDGAFDEGRSSMYSGYFTSYVDGSLFELFFGRGYADPLAGQGHNAYLVLLLMGGLCMCSFLIFAIFFSFTRAIYVYKHSRTSGGLLISFLIVSALYMVAQTPILFFSTIDSYFITFISILIPLYSYNAYKYCQYESSPN